MKKTGNLFKYFAWSVLLALSIAFIIKFGSPQLLRFYVRTGIGDCQKIPIFCMSPLETLEIKNLPSVSDAGLVPYCAYKISAFVPRGFNVVQELFIKSSYKKYNRMHKGDVIYMLCQDKDFFARLYPQLKKAGVTDNYEFIRRVMNANEEKIGNVNDAFFLIMKGIFIPDIGNQANAKMVKISLSGLKGFMNYNLDASGNYFDSSLVDEKGNFFKVYIKNKSKNIDLETALAVISTLRCRQE